MYVHSRFPKCFTIGLLAVLFTACGGQEDPSPKQQTGIITEDLRSQQAEFVDEMGVQSARSVGTEEDGKALVLPAEALQVVRGVISPEEMVAREEERQRDGIRVADRRPDDQIVTDKVLDDAKGRSTNELVEVVVRLQEPGFDFTRIAELKGDDEGLLAGLTADGAREAIVAERKAQVAPSQAAFIKEAEALGATSVSGFWLANMVSMEIPSGHVAELAALPGVVGITPVGHNPTLDAQITWGYEGDTTKNGTRLMAFQNAGYAGDHYGRVDGLAMRIGFIEFDQGGNNCIDATLPDDSGTNNAFYEWDGGENQWTSRIKAKKYCTAASCAADACWSNAFPGTHGTHVAGVAIGDMGVRFNTPYSRWMATEGEGYYYRTRYEDGSNAVAKAVQAAVADGMDVITMAFSFAGACDLTTDLSGLNQIFRSALDAGTIPVASAGNLGDPGVGTCNMHYPALRPETLVAGGLTTSYVTEQNPFTPPSAEYDTLPVFAPTNRGGGTITVGGSAHSAVNIVNLVLPAEYGSVTDDYVAGTSFSAGVLAGAVAVVRNAYGPLGWQSNARIVMTDQMLFGDGWNSDTGNKMSAGGSPRTGYGRVKFHYPSNNNLTAPWGWGG
ncbi:MAG: S8 family serine peptidase, partial [bacterium]|nr:S8 family serine peptidase [bacterium]